MSQFNNVLGRFISKVLLFAAFMGIHTHVLASDASQVEKADHLVFLIHGVGGNENSFGHMNEALSRHLNGLNPQSKVMVFNFKYPTSDDILNTDHFALMFDAFILSQFDRYANDDAKISIVAHSQGGLVTTIWYYRSYLQTPGFHPELARKLQTVVSIGTPFWGSKVATWVAKNTDLFRHAKKYFGERLGPVNAVGETQVLDMALGSPNIQTFRRNLMSFSKQEIENIFTHIRVLNIHGNANLKRILMKENVAEKIQQTHKWFSPDMLTKLLPFVFGSIEYEADGMVSIPASTINTIYASDLNTNYPDEFKLTDKSFGELQIADRLVVKTVHASTEPELVHDMAYIPAACVTDSECDHPTYKYVLDYLNHRDLSRSFPVEETLPAELIGAGQMLAAPDVKIQNFGGFTLDVNVRLPKGYEHLREKVKVFIHPQCLQDFPIQDLNKIPQVVVNRPTEFYSHVRQETETYKDSVLNWYTGHVLFKNETDNKYNEMFRKQGTKVRISVVAPGMKTRHIDALVKPTLSTYIDVMLGPKVIKNENL